MTTTRASLTNWSGNVVFGARHLHRPDSLDELRRIVAGSRRIRALGTGHSFSRIADTTADLVRLDRLPQNVEIDSVRQRVRVPAAMSYAELATTLERAGFALANLASLPHICVAGSCASGTHGSGDQLRCLSAAVVALELIGPQGDLMTISRDADPEVFPGYVVALGALGIVTRLTIQIEPSFQVAQEVRLEVPLEYIARHLDDVFGAAYSVSAFTNWGSGQAAVWLKHRLDHPKVPVVSFGRPAGADVHPVPGQSPESSTEQLGVPGPWHERLPHFRPEHTPSVGRELQSEFLVPRTAAPAAIAAIQEIASTLAPVLQITELRTVRGDDLWLSPAYQRDSFAVHFTLIDDVAAVAPVLRQVEERLVPMGARPHWAKLTTLPGAAICAGYERAADFAELARSFDPDGKFRNAFVDDLFQRSESCWPSVT